LLGAWTAKLSERRTQPRSPGTPAAHEAARLLRRLSDLAGGLEGGFDAPAAAELLLQAVNNKIPGSRMAVLIGEGSEPAVPLALHGIDRLPWPSPTTAASGTGRDAGPREQRKWGSPPPRCATRKGPGSAWSWSIDSRSPPSPPTIFRLW